LSTHNYVNMGSNIPLEIVYTESDNLLFVNYDTAIHCLRLKDEGQNFDILFFQEFENQMVYAIDYNP